LTSSIPLTTETAGNVEGEIRYEPLYIVDTHALIWYLTRDKKLSSTALKIFQAAERGETRLGLSVIVLAELYYANAKNKWFDNYGAVYNDIVSKSFFKFFPLDESHITDFDRDNAVPEMHDRIITGIARRLNVPLISADPLIIAAAIVKIVW